MLNVSVPLFHNHIFFCLIFSSTLGTLVITVYFLEQYKIISLFYYQLISNFGSICNLNLLLACSLKYSQVLEIRISKALFCLSHQIYSKILEDTEKGLLKLTLTRDFEERCKCEQYLYSDVRFSSEMLFPRQC